MTSAHVLSERRGPALLVTLNRPDARNAYSDEMIEGLCAAFDAAEASDEVRAVVLTGAGTSFSAGGDVKLMRARAGMFAGDAAALRNRYAAGIQRVPRRIARFGKPLLAAINGPAVGAGLDLACMCDLRIAAAGATLGCTFVKLGLVPGDGGAYFLARTIGLPRALELALTGRLVDASEALAMGLVHRLVPDGAAVDAALALADELAALPATALRLTKAACYQSYGLPLEHALELAATYQGVAQNHPEHAAALARPKAPAKGDS